jgi:hypothetical protein
MILRSHLLHDFVHKEKRTTLTKAVSMSYNIRIIQAREFVRAMPEGVLDLEQSKKLLVAIATAAKGSENYAVLVDMRRSTPELSVPDMWNLVDQLYQLGETYQRKTAVLGTFEQYENIVFFALASQSKGFHIGAFSSFEDAIEWLIA